MQTGLVNVWNEWDELEEIGVGIAADAHFEPAKPGNRPALRDKTVAERFPRGAKKQAVIEQANEELDGLVKLLERQGVTVRLPVTPPLKSTINSQEFWEWPLEERFAHMYEFEFCITQIVYSDVLLLA